MVTRIPERKRGHKFIPQQDRSRFCKTCQRMSHYRLHQPLWWRILHRDLYR